MPATATPAYIFAPPRETPTARVPAHIHARALNHTYHHYYASVSSRPKMEGKVGVILTAGVDFWSGHAFRL